jgi:hypothetical protein
MIDASTAGFREFFIHRASATFRWIAHYTVKVSWARFVSLMGCRLEMGDVMKTRLETTSTRVQRTKVSQPGRKPIAPWPTGRSLSGTPLAIITSRGRKIFRCNHQWDVDSHFNRWASSIPIQRSTFRRPKSVRAAACDAEHRCPDE